MMDDELAPHDERIRESSTRVVVRKAPASGPSRANQLLATVEAVHAAGDDRAWEAGLVAALERIFPRSQGAAIVAIEEARSRISPAARAELYRTRSLVSVTSELSPRVSREARRALLAELAATCADDAVRITVEAAPGVIVAAFVAFDRRIRLTRYERTLLSRVALHLETAARLRRGTAHLGVLSHDGTRLRSPVHGSARPMLERGRRTPGAVHLWEALARGRATLAPSVAGYLVLGVPEHAQTRRRLTDEEAIILRRAGAGTSGKALSFALNVSTSTVSRCLCNAAAKTGVPSSFELVRLVSRMAIDAPRPLVLDALTPAERDVLELLRAGLSNEAIALARGRSYRTVANQVASILRRTKCSSRRAIAAAL